MLASSFAIACNRTVPFEGLYRREVLTLCFEKLHVWVVAARQGEYNNRLLRACNVSYAAENS